LQSRGGRYPHIIRAILGRPWAIDPESLAWAAICDVLALRAAGEVLSEEEIQARIQAAATGPRRGRSQAGQVAILPLYGPIFPRANLLGSISGGTSAEQLRADVQAVMADPDIAGVLFDVDSPGGDIQGITELAATIREARGTKPMVAIANHDMASAAYWAMSGVDEIVATPSSRTGAIGVITAHDDLTGALAQEGIVRTVISAGRFKAEGMFGQSLSDEAKAAIQATVDTIYGVEAADVAAGRGVTSADIRSGFGQGRVVLAKAAKAAGLVDRIDTFDNTVARLVAGNVPMRSVTAAADPRLITAAAPDTSSELEETTEPDEADTAREGEDASLTPPTAEARIPGRRDQRQLRELALGLGYSISD
jgi:signal peptide peptidase SppA